MAFSCALDTLASGTKNINIPEAAATVDYDCSIEALKSKLKSVPLQPVEGIWYYNEDKTTVLIERVDSEESRVQLTYRIVYVNSDDYDVLPGTVVGYIEPSAEIGKYVLWIYSEIDVGSLTRPVKCVATLSSEGDVLTFVRTKWKFKFRANLARFLPSLFKGLSLLTDYDEAKIPLGFRKIFPARDGDGTTNGVIRYL
ncbi:MAG: hypothetical protein ACI4AH_02390 [Muribaculaceae bacterium]